MTGPPALSADHRATAGSPPTAPGARRRRLADALLAAAVAYVSLTTVDADVVGVPLKLPIVAAALLGWIWAREKRPAPREFLVSWSVLCFGMVVPAGWFCVALATAGTLDTEVLRPALQEASRFVYVLLYFPLVDWLRRQRSQDDHRIWLIPVYVLCGLTWAFYLGHVVLGLDYGQTGQVGPFRGAIAVDATGVFRSFLIDDVLFIPALALILGRLRLQGLTGSLTLQAVAVLSSLYLAHTRGLWLGVVVVAVAVAFSEIASGRRHVRVFAALLATAYVCGFAINAAPSAARDVIVPVLGRTELSLSQRLDQGGALWDAFTRRPVLGSGMGASLAPGLERSAENPWSFELTWLQLLFQLGVVGVGLVIAAPILAFLASLRFARGADNATRVRVAAAVGGLAGFLLACGSNPYLTTSVGTLCLAILLAMCDSATGARRPA